MKVYNPDSIIQDSFCIQDLRIGIRIKIPRNRFTLSDLESELETIDKSTIFRTLILFQQHNLVHTIDDGSGSLKYAICYEGCDCSIDQLHAHFYCTECKKVFCLRDTPIPVIALPDNFSTDTINYVVKGKCDQCRNIAT